MFPCTDCGVCCQNISNVIELKDFDMGNGVCCHYNIEHSHCSIYDCRPNICNIDKMFALKYYKEFSKQGFYNVNVQTCNDLQSKYGIDIKYRVEIN